MGVIEEFVMAAGASLTLQGAVAFEVHSSNPRADVETRLDHLASSVEIEPAKDSPSVLKYSVVGAAMGLGMGAMVGYWVPSAQESGSEVEPYPAEGAVIGAAVGAVFGYLIARAED